MRLSSIAHILATLAFLTALPQCSDSRDVRKNVILISIDTLRRDALGCYGADPRISPRLDELAQRSLMFEAAISQAPWTLPSHAAMLTSLYPSELDLGTFGKVQRVHSDATTLAEALQSMQYATFAFVAGAFLAKTTGLEQGFEEYDDRASTMTIVVDRCIERLRKHERSRPFFTFLHTYDVHKYDPPEADRALFAKTRPEQLARVPSKAVAEILQNNKNQERVRTFGDADRRYARELYDSSVHAVDREIGRLLDALVELDLADDTILVITSDHGEEFWEHERTGHGYNLNDENIRVPLLIHVPGGPRGKSNSQVRTIDISPTLAAVVGVPRAVGWQGQDLFARHATNEGDLIAFSESAHLPFKSVRLSGVKLVVSLRKPYVRWYDLVADPLEQHALETLAHPDAERVERALRDWVLSTSRETRYRGQATAVVDETVARDISALGYSSSSDTTPTAAEPWLRALDGLPPNPGSK